MNIKINLQEMKCNSLIHLHVLQNYHTSIVSHLVTSLSIIEVVELSNWLLIYPW
jgi:hypothetical protein